MGLLDKLKGHKKTDSAKSFDDVAEKRGKRSSSLSRPADRGHVGARDAVPEMPTSAGTTTGIAQGETVASYPVDGATTVGGHTGQQSHHQSTSTNLTGNNARPRAVNDNASTTAVLDGRVGEPEVDGLSKSMAQTNLASGTSYQPHTYKRESLTSTPFDREAFHSSFGAERETTTYESSIKAAVVQETVRQTLHEEVHPIFHREHHILHHQTRIQPVLEQVLLPPKHYVMINGQKHEILADAIMNHVVKSRDYIPMAGQQPKVIVHEYVKEPLVGPVTGVGASLINKDVMLEHQRKINHAYELKNSGREHDIPTGQITTVNYMAGQVPVSTERGTGSSSLAESAVAGHQSHSHSHSHHQSSSDSRGVSGNSYPAGQHLPGHANELTHAQGQQGGGDSTTGNHMRLEADDAIERSSGRLTDQRAAF